MRSGGHGRGVWLGRRAHCSPSRPLWWCLASLALLLSGCAGSPGPVAAPAGPTPAQLSRDPSLPPPRQLEWGGAVISLQNLPRRTLIEVMAYPLDRDRRPRTDAAPQGRFLVEREGPVDPTRLAPGRLVTVRGPLRGWRRGEGRRVPVIRGGEIRLWVSPPAPGRRGPPVSVGIGVNNYGGGVGIGVGF